jgi:hypothetical protein
LLIENLVAGPASEPGSACGMTFPASVLAVEDAVNNDGPRGAAIELSLARIRQLSAHEVGHTLGIAHNFAASTYGDRASVMDYPAPRFKVTEDGGIDGSDAYGVGIGIWDKLTIDCMYKVFPAQQETREYLDSKLKKAIEDGVRYISDSDARPTGGAHPLAHLWDNGSDPVAELKEVLKVRAVGLSKFSAERLLDGEAQGELLRLFAPLYFHHRFQVEAVVKLIGGVDYAYSLPGDSNAATTVVPVEQQSAAVEALLATIDPPMLSVDESLIRLVLPASTTNAWSIEEPSGFTGPVFDPLGLAETAAALPVSLMLHPARMARLANQGIADAEHPGTDLVLIPLTEIIVRFFLVRDGDRFSPMEVAVSFRVATVSVNQMIALAENDAAREDVRAAVIAQLKSIKGQLGTEIVRDRNGVQAEAAWTYDKLSRFLERPDLRSLQTREKQVPPGSPIGG